MVKTQEKETAETPQPSQSSSNHRLATSLRRITLVAVVVLAAYGLWRNPQIVTQIKSSLSSFSSEKQEDIYQKQINLLESRLQSLQNQLAMIANRRQNPVADEELAAMKEKIAAIEKTNLNVIDSKADVATVLGVVTRMDKAEQRLDKMAQVSEEGALILTAVMLVKDSAERGGNYEYEMEVLEQISADNTKFAEQFAVMNKYAAEGIASTETLQKDFNAVYRKLMKVQKESFEKTWKDRLNAKINEIVKIKRKNAEYDNLAANADLKRAKDAVERGAFKEALQALENPAGNELLKNPDLLAWKDKVQARLDFYSAVSRISASSLAMMKVNFLKKAN